MSSQHQTIVVFACPKCPAVYQAKQHVVPTTCFGVFHCIKCTTQVYAWHGTYDFSDWTVGFLVGDAPKGPENKILGQNPGGHRGRWGGVSFVIRCCAASIAVKATAEFSKDNLESNRNEIDTNILVAFVKSAPVRLRKLDDAGLSAFRAF
jgi:hypothetical protein